MIDYTRLFASRTSFESYRPPKDLPYDFQVADPDPAHFPAEHILEAARSTLRLRGSDIAPYPPELGDPGLREVIAERSRILDNLSVPTDQIIVTTGSTQGLCLMADTFVDVGDTIIAEVYTYPGALRAFNRCSPSIIGVPVDENGMDLERLAGVLEDLGKRNVKAKMIYTITSFQNPTGVVMSMKRRKELLGLAKDYNIMVFEDDVYGDLIYEGEPLTPLFALSGGEGVVKLGSFSKIVGAGMRLGWLIVPKQVVPKILVTKVDAGVNSLSMMVVGEYMKNNMSERLEEMRGVYRAKRDAMLDALEDYLGSTAEWSHPRGGLFIWLKTPRKVDSDKLLKAAHENGVNYYPGPRFSPEGRGTEYLRLAYSYYSPEEIRTGVKLLAEAMEKARTA